MFSFRRKGVQRRGPLRRGARRGARRTAGRMLLRITFRLARPLGPGVMAAATGSYFFDRAAGSERRKKALARLTALLASARRLREKQSE